MSKVTIVGAGPGDPDLLTMGAYKYLQSANVVLYDALVSKEILDMIPNKTEKIFVGKRALKQSINQKDIGELLVEYSKKYESVVRLKGGDSTIYARLSEEIKVLIKNKIPFKILAGVTAFSGAAAHLKMPLTDRFCGSEFLITTAKTYEEATACKSIAKFLNQGSGVAIYMPLHKGSKIISTLRGVGANPELPLVFVCAATTKNQRVLAGHLSEFDYQKLKDFAKNDASIVLVGEPFKEYEAQV